MKSQSTLYTVALLVGLSQAVLADANDDLRVSSNFFDGNYHTITPDRGRRPARRDDVPNQLGKPLVAHAQPTAAPPSVRAKSTKKPAQAAGGWSSRSKWLPQQPLPEPVIAHAATDTGTGTRELSASAAAAAARNVCRWISLSEMANTTYATGEVIVRDAADQPCYILTMYAYIKWNEDAYFPLQHYRAHPFNAYKMQLATSEPAADAHSQQRLLLNCSLPLPGGGGSEGGAPISSSVVSLVSAQRSNRAFTEEITIQVSCGYLLLQLRGDATYLALESISFYQDGNDSGAGTRDNARTLSGADVANFLGANAQRNSPAAVAAPSSSSTSTIHSRHLVFTTEGQAQLTPLFVMPTFSRYLCLNRIVLTGNNSVQLVISRFELKRLTNEPAATATAAAAASGPAAVSARPVVGAPGELDGEQDAWRDGRDIFVDTRPRRDVHAGTILYKSPMVAVTKCSNPTAPGVPLTTMMDRDDVRGNDTIGAAAASRRLAASDASALSARPLVHVIALNLVILALLQGRSIHSHGGLWVEVQ